MHRQRCSHPQRRARSGDPILCIHGAGSSTQLWADAVEELAQLGRVIAYDRRGCSRSERPPPYERTSVSEHADDAAELLVRSAPRPPWSSGAAMAARSRWTWRSGTRSAFGRLPCSRATPRASSRRRPPGGSTLAGGVGEAAERAGVDAVGEELIDEILGEGVWPQVPEQMRRVLTENGPAILAELDGEWWLEADADALADIEQPVLLVAAADSRPELRQPSEALAPPYAERAAGRRRGRSPDRPGRAGGARLRARGAQRIGIGARRRRSERAGATSPP